MIIIENSNIVNWDDYPEYICAVVMQTTKDLLTTRGLVMPAGEEMTWLFDKAPKICGDDVHFIRPKINCLGGFYPIGMDDCDDLPLDFKEIHFKPKPVVKIEEKQECYA